MRPAIAIMAKEPVPGGVKTRLLDVLSPADAAEVYRAFLLDKIDQVASVPGAEPYLAYTGSKAAFEELAGGRVGLVEQAGSDLGERLAHVAGELSQRHDGVLLVDSDTPNLPSETLAEAATALRTHDVVIGPAWDGGYYLVGIRHADAALFGDVEWSTPHVLAQTLRNAASLGLLVHFLASWYDVDHPTDLERLALDLSADTPARPGYPVRTADAVRRLHPASPEPERNERWKTLASRRVYQNRWTRVDESVVELPGGDVTLYGVVTCPRCVGIVPVLPDGRVLLVRQFRYIARRDTWEIPTGGVATGERLEQAAQRELMEECGYRAGRLEHLSTFHTSKGVMDEVAHIYVGLDLVPAAADPDATESIEVCDFALADTLDMVSRGEIVDSMSVVGILLAERTPIGGSS